MEFPGRGDGRGEPGGTPLPARWSHPPGGQVLAPFALICCLCRPGADGRARCSPARLLEPRHGIAPRPARAAPVARRPAPRMAGRVRASDHRAEVPPARPIDPTKERTSAVGRVPPAANDGAPGGRALQGPGNLRRHQRPPAAHFTTGHRTKRRGRSKGPWVASTLAIAVAPREAGAPRSEVRSSEPAGGREERDGRGIKHRAHTPAPYRPASAPVAADGRLEGAPLPGSACRTGHARRWPWPAPGWARFRRVAPCDPDPDAHMDPHRAPGFASDTRADACARPVANGSPRPGIPHLTPRGPSPHTGAGVRPRLVPPGRVTPGTGLAGPRPARRGLRGAGAAPTATGRRR